MDPVNMARVVDQVVLVRMDPAARAAAPVIMTDPAAGPVEVVLAGPGQNGPGGPGRPMPGGWHPAPPPPPPGGRPDMPPPRDGAPDWGWGPGQGYVPQWAAAKPPPPLWAPFARVFWSTVRDSWGFWWGPIWFPI